MTVPTKTKTWQFNVNQTILWQSTQTATIKALLLAIKNGLKGFSTLPWTVVGSSNSVAAGLDAVDRWSTVSNIVFAADGVAHSWIVLKQTGLDTNFQLLIECSTTLPGSDIGGRVYMSPSAGFTGGSITARPTATDEVGVGNGTNGTFGYWGVTSSSYALQLHMMQSTDGQATRIILTQADPLTTFAPICTLFACFEKLADAVTNYTIPVVGMWYGQLGTSNTLTSTILFNTSAGSEPLFSRVNAGNMRGTMTVPGVAQSSGVGPVFFNFPNQLSNNWDMYPVGYYVPNTTSRRGRHGQFQDMWMGAFGQPFGMSYPNDGSLAFMQFGPLILPWDGSTYPRLS